MRKMVRSTPRRSQRRPEVATRARKEAGGPRRFIALLKAMSSMSAICGKPAKASRRTKIAWSPVAMALSRERRFIAQATTASSRCRPSMVTSNRPHSLLFKAFEINSSARAGRRVSACRKTSASPPACRAPAFICKARPRGASMTRSQSGRARAGVPSSLPPSATITSWPRPRSGASCPMLREEAYVGHRLERQLEEQAVRFLSDRSRNRFARGGPGAGTLQVSKIFDWYKEHFEPRAAYFARYSRLLADDADGQSLIAQGKAPLGFVEYDWALNDVRK